MDTTQAGGLMELQDYRRSFLGRWATLTAGILVLYGVYNLNSWMFAQDVLHRFSMTGRPPNVYVVLSVTLLGLGFLITIWRGRPSKLAVLLALIVICEGAIDLVEAYIGIESEWISRLLTLTTGQVQTVNHTLTPMEAFGVICTALLLLDLNYPKLLRFYVTAVLGGVVALVTLFGVYTSYLDIPQSILLFKVSSQAPIMIGVVGLCVMSAMISDTQVRARSKEVGVALSFAIGGVLAIFFMMGVLSNNSDQRIRTFGEAAATSYVDAQNAQVRATLQGISRQIIQFSVLNDRAEYDTLFEAMPIAVAFIIKTLGDDPNLKIATRDGQPLDPQILQHIWYPVGDPVHLGGGLFAYRNELGGRNGIRLGKVILQPGKVEGFILIKAPDPFDGLVRLVTPDSFEIMIRNPEGEIIYQSPNAQTVMEAYSKFVVHTQITIGDLAFPVLMVPEEEIIESFQDENVAAVLFFAVLTWLLAVYALYQWFVNRRSAMELVLQSRDLKKDLLAVEERREQIEQFATVAAHDMKSPLNAIMSIEEWLREDLEPYLNDETRGMFDDIEARVTHLRDMAGSLLAYYRSDKSSVALDTVDVKEMVMRISASQPPECKHDIVCTNLPTLHTAVAPLEQILANLITNALKYHDGDQPSIHVSAEQQGAFWRFRVADDGPGIPAAMQDKVFDPFASALPKDKRKGTGLGLSIVRRLVMGLGGEVGIEQGIEGRGTCVYFDWPGQWPG